MLYPLSYEGSCSFVQVRALPSVLRRRHRPLLAMIAAGVRRGISDAHAARPLPSARRLKHRGLIKAPSLGSQLG